MNALAETIPQAAGDWPRMPRIVGRQPATGYVYVAGFMPTSGVLFVKGGKASSAVRRMRDYAGMLPGGLSFSYSVEADNPSESEREFLNALADRPEFESVGGEWFKCALLDRFMAFDLLRAVGRNFQPVRVTGWTTPRTGGRRKRCRFGGVL
jgi:hypothetical protein